MTEPLDNTGFETSDREGPDRSMNINVEMLELVNVHPSFNTRVSMRRLAPCTNVAEFNSFSEKLIEFIRSQLPDVPFTMYRTS
jgi:hypothetical protein